ncbi:MAG: HD domain-containing protein [Chloroflexota bacterium]
MGVLYRVRQFTAALRGASHQTSALPLETLLTPAELRLLLDLPGAYRDHAERVYRRLREQGRSDEDLLKAALLHDVGKATARIRLPHRVLGVLLRNLALPLLLWLAREAPATSWRYPFYVQRHHAGIGARLVAAAGASPRVVALVAKHHDPQTNKTDHALAFLRDADGAE